MKAGWEMQSYLVHELMNACVFWHIFPVCVHLWRGVRRKPNSMGNLALCRASLGKVVLIFPFLLFPFSTGLYWGQWHGGTHSMARLAAVPSPAPTLIFLAQLPATPQAALVGIH